MISRWCTYRILAAITVALTPRLASADEVAVWGIESLDCGQQLYKLQLGPGGDVLLKSMQGSVSASQSQTADIKSPMIRQSITSIFAEVNLGKPADAQVIEKPQSPLTNQSIDPHLAQINVKQSGDKQIHFPVAYTFGNGVIIPGGRLAALISSESYAANPDSVIRDNPRECVSTEVHLTLTFAPQAADASTVAPLHTQEWPEVRPARSSNVSRDMPSSSARAGSNRSPTTRGGVAGSSISVVPDNGVRPQRQVR